MKYIFLDINDIVIHISDTAPVISDTCVVCNGEKFIQQGISVVNVDTVPNDVLCQIYKFDRPTSSFKLIESLDVDDTSISMASNGIQIAGFDTAPVNSELCKGNTGVIWRESTVHDINNLATKTELSDLLDKYMNDKNINSWETIQDIVRSGMAPMIFEIGDQFISHHSIYGDIVWDIVGFDVDVPADKRYNHSMSLQTHDIIISGGIDSYITIGRVYNLPDGFDYHETYHLYTDVNTNNNYCIIFDSLQNPYDIIGDWYLIGNALWCRLRDTSRTHTHIGSIEIRDKWDNDEFGTSNDRVFYTGTFETYIGKQPAYSTSLINTWLNSNSESPLYDGDYDRTSPTWAVTMPGFMYGLDKELISVIGDVILPDSTDDTHAKIFLPSLENIYTTHTDIWYPYYTTGSSGTKYHNNIPKNWWLRTYGYTNDAICHDNMAIYEYGISPVCCII